MLAFASGGYFVGDWGVASIVLLGLAAAGAIALRPSFGGRWGIGALAGLATFAAWQGVSSGWASEPAAAIRSMNQTLLYVAAFALALIGVRRVTDLVWLTRSVLAVCAVVVGWGLLQRLLPDIIDGDVPGRLASPISYWNALGALAALGVVLAVSGAGDRGSARWVRGVHAALVPLLLLALLLTFSRGAVVALAAGLVTLVALAPGRVGTTLALIVTVAASVPLLAIANGQATIASLDRRIVPDPGEGETVLWVLLASMAVAAALGLAVAVAGDRLGARGRRTAGLALAGTAAAVVIALGVVAMPSQGPVGWADDQFDSFRAFETTERTSAASLSDRLAVAAGSGRWQNWEVAVDEFGSSPVVGTGAGDYRFWWAAERPMDLSVQNAHSLYLEVLAETGVIGLLLLVGSLAAIVVGIALALRAGPDDDAARPLAVALAATAVIGVHMAGDWVWQLPAVVIPAVVLAGGALAVARTAHGGAAVAPRAVRACVAVAAVAAIALVVGPVASSGSLDTARALAADGELDRALDHSRRAGALDPQSPAPRLLEANILADLGRPSDADRAFAAAARRSPDDWAVYADWGAALVRRGDVRSARTAVRRAERLNPLEPRPRYLREALRG